MVTVLQVEFLCDRGADVNRGLRSSSLHYAACFGRPQIVKVCTCLEHFLQDRAFTWSLECWASILLVNTVILSARTCDKFKAFGWSVWCKSKADTGFLILMCMKQSLFILFLFFDGKLHVAVFMFLMLQVSDFAKSIIHTSKCVHYFHPVEFL